MKITSGNNENEKTTLEDDAAIYAKRDERPAKERFKDLRGEEKWQFFKDYILGKLIIGVVIAALLIHLLYSIFGPKPENIMYVAVIDDPFGSVYIDKMTAELTELFVRDPKKEEIRLDSDFYFVSNDYNLRMKLMTMIAGKDIDFIILPEGEFKLYMDSDIFADLSTVLTGERLKELEAYRVEFEGVPYALDITGVVSKILGVEILEKYYVGCIVNSDRQERFDAFVEYLFGK